MWQPMELPYESLPGLSKKLLEAHYGLYLRYLDRWDELHHRLQDAPPGDPFEYGRLLAEEGMLRNAVRLHELYFENLTPGGAGDPFDVVGDDEMYVRWEDRFHKAALASTGWVIRAMDLATGRLFDFTMSSHAHGFVALAVPLLVIDCYEHSYMSDYGIDKGAYLDAVLVNVDWNIVTERARVPDPLMKALV